MEVEGIHEFNPNAEEHETNANNQELPMNPGEYNEIRVILNDPLSHSMTTSVSFDTHEQLFWAGTQRVKICFFHYFPFILFFRKIDLFKFSPTFQMIAN